MTAWLTRIVTDRRSSDVQRDHINATATHRRLMSLFPDNAGPDPRVRFGVLFRTEDSTTGPVLLIQSNTQPDLTELPAGYAHSHDSRSLDSLLDALRPGLRVHYRCVASPVRKPGRTTRAHYNLPSAVPLTGAAADEWWLRQAATSGLQPLHLHSQQLDAAIAHKASPDSKDPRRFRHTRTRFEGTATITDAELLRAQITGGIGRGKAYGCGLLSIAPAHAAAAP
ncbi:type I-E CRISPR-associated protein Cas6/Cse3/CasE [Streptomyces virginiae]|uniref:type I-E CRISPR-associated protein Cas6/Cse3/CasE n=1 Tax=Streptomyces virginiae TaxID=1961 RepID=UPI00382EF0B3